MSRPARYHDYSKWLNVPPVCRGTRCTCPGLLTEHVFVLLLDRNLLWGQFYAARTNAKFGGLQ